MFTQDTGLGRLVAKLEYLSLGECFNSIFKSSRFSEEFFALKGMDPFKSFLIE